MDVQKYLFYLIEDTRQLNCSIIEIKCKSLSGILHHYLLYFFFFSKLVSQSLFTLKIWNLTFLLTFSFSPSCSWYYKKSWLLSSQMTTSNIRPMRYSYDIINNNNKKCSTYINKANYWKCYHKHHISEDYTRVSSVTSHLL